MAVPSAEDGQGILAVQGASHAAHTSFSDGSFNHSCEVDNQYLAFLLILIACNYHSSNVDKEGTLFLRENSKQCLVKFHYVAEIKSLHSRRH